ncbi:HAD hydrolase-like protein [Breznakiella homolactica]|uniref:HAD hydrolase-like protein n=1 Tax=Breznakiella homolactica TaxID=2798577 RepID=A0A7T7XP78_9SPIR|nr:HAD hydrolase-like protein [Breznakiella homolactica]QQO09938.1 HAD hydrolase-like protein [Breznakiella homolactica]
MKYTHVLFDLDGTLTDPYEGVINSFKYVFRHFGIDEVNEEKLARFIGPPLGNTFRDEYGLTGKDNERALEVFREYYADRGMYENRVYDGIEDVLRQLTDSGINCAVATSKGQAFAEKVLEHFGLARYFCDIAGSSPDGSLSEKADIIAYVIAKHSLPKTKTLMVGDRKFDIIGARENGIDSLAVGYGHGLWEELDAAKPTYYCRDMESLAAFFR